MTDTVLIVEDDKNTANLVALYLKQEGFETIIAHDGRHAIELAQHHKPIFVILDLMLPLLDGWEVCRQLRQSSDVPILILSAREEEVDRVSGLTLGADDYVVKPFSPRELVARVKAILRRGRMGGMKNQRVYICEGMSSPGKVYTRDQLLDHLYPKKDANVIDRVVDVHIGKLRQKIEREPSNPRYILTVRGVGYQFLECSTS